MTRRAPILDVISLAATWLCVWFVVQQALGWPWLPQASLATLVTIAFEREWGVL